MQTLKISKQSELLLPQPDHDGPGKIRFDVNRNRRMVVEASAGTGKTFALEELVLELTLVQGIPLQKILLVTFTEKASTELKSRLRGRLQEIVQAVDSGSEWLGDEAEGPCWQVDLPRSQELKAALLDFDAVPVYTIHGFCHRMMKEFAFENRQLFNQQLTETRTLGQDLFRTYLRKRVLPGDAPFSRLFSLYLTRAEGKLAPLEKDLFELLPWNIRFAPALPAFAEFLEKYVVHWREWVKYDKGLRLKSGEPHPLREAFQALNLRGGASENKTMRHLDRVIEILGNAHAGTAMEECFIDLLPLNLRQITNPPCTLSLKAGKRWSSPEELPEDERKWLKQLDTLAGFLEEQGLEIRHDQNPMSKVARLLRGWLIQQMLPELRAELAHAKQKEGVYDFDDMLRIVEENVRPGHSGNKPLMPTPLTRAIREKYLCAIVDEFQDTDTRQWSIFRDVFLESPDHRLFVIGDPKQAIYGFRGAEVQTYLEAREMLLAREHSARLSLARNFRSSKEVISGINRIFGASGWFSHSECGMRNAECGILNCSVSSACFRGQKRPEGIFYLPVKCGNPEIAFLDPDSSRRGIHLFVLQPRFQILRGKLQKIRGKRNPPFPPEILDALERIRGRLFRSEEIFLRAVAEETGPDAAVEFREALLQHFLQDNRRPAERELAEEIALEISRLLERRPLWRSGNTGEERPLREKDICVLFRKSSEGELLAPILRRRGIAHSFYKQRGLFQTREAREVLDLLQAIAHPDQPSRIRQSVLTRFFDVPFSECGMRNAECGILNCSVSSACFRGQIGEWDTLAKNGNFPRLFDQILQQTLVVQRELFLSGHERGVSNTLQVLEYLNRLVHERGLSLHDITLLLHNTIAGELVPAEDDNLLRLESDQEAVQLMTMHAAKGLEFPVVFLCGGFSQDPPSSWHRYHNELREPVLDLFSSPQPEAARRETSGERERMYYVALTRAGGRLYLPYAGCLPGDSGKRHYRVSESPLGCLLPTLDGIIEELKVPGTGNENEDLEESVPFHFSASTVQPKEITRASGTGVSRIDQGTLQNWNPPNLPDRPGILANQPDPDAFLSRLRREHGGFVVTSFSAISRKQEQKGLENSLHGDAHSSTVPYQTLADDELEEPREADEPQTDHPDPLDPNRHSRDLESLPGGIRTGNYLHEVLERIDYAEVMKQESCEIWSHLPLVNKLLRAQAEKHGISEDSLPRAAEIIWHTLRREIRLGDEPGTPRIRIGDCGKKLREMKFYFPLPDDRHSFTLLGQIRPDSVWPGEGWRIKRGFLTGSIDLLFEHEQKVYLLDWKSNLLGNYQQESLRDTVHEHYLLQLKIYALATTRWLRIDNKQDYERRFGGILYLFLRGMPAGEAVFFACPSWSELMDFQPSLQHAAVGA